MFTVIGLMLAGMLAGFLLRKHALEFIRPTITVLIWALLFLLGVEVGGNEDILRGLHTIGLEAVVLTLGGTLGSVAAARLLWQAMTDGKKRKTEQADTSRSAQGSTLHALRGSLIIVGFFALGIGCSFFGAVPGHVGSRVSFYILCTLMTCVGVNVGNDPQTLKNFRSLNPRLVFLPVMTIAGTLAGTALVSLLLTHRNLTDCLAVGSGFGYYSLSSIFITEYRGAELGTVALLANISRELLTLLTAPLLARWFGPLAPISAGGATTADTTLPLIIQTSGQALAVVSIFHGFVVDFSVPFLVTLWCMA